MAQEQKDKSFEEAKHEVAALQRVEASVPGATWFASEFSFVEAIVRGFRSGFLKPKDYVQLQNCEALDEVKLALSDTDYCNVLTGVAKLTPDIIYKKCEDKFLQEFAYIQAQATGQLATFLEFITYEDLITNISFVITSLIRGADPESLLAKCLPLGRSAHLRSIMTFENYEGSDGLVELYRNVRPKISTFPLPPSDHFGVCFSFPQVLVDTPVAPYFERYFNSELRSDAPSREIQRVYSEVEIDIITNVLQKLWLEDFYQLCKSFGGETWDFMKPVLEFEADRRAIAITINSFGTSLNEVNNRDSERKALYCSFGQVRNDLSLSLSFAPLFALDYHLIFTCLFSLFHFSCSLMLHSSRSAASVIITRSLWLWSLTHFMLICSANLRTDKSRSPICCTNMRCRS